MAKRRLTQNEPAASEGERAPLNDLLLRAAARVLRSQGHAIGRLPSLPEWMQRELAELVGVDGLLVADVRHKVAELFDRYHAELKAVVVDEPSTEA